METTVAKRDFSEFDPDDQRVLEHLEEILPGAVEAFRLVINPSVTAQDAADKVLNVIIKSMALADEDEVLSYGDE